MLVGIRCPLCETKGEVEIPTDLVEKSNRGVVSINVPSNLVCEHNFQLFLDRNGVVRGYQRIDFQIGGSQVSEVPNTPQSFTKFRCKICNEEIHFDINNKSTFFTKKDQESYFGMQLSTYQVAHMKGEVMHLNSVVVDGEGKLQGIVEAYPVPISEFLTNGIVPQFDHTLRIIAEDQPPLRQHEFLEVLLVVDFSTQQVLNLVCPPVVNGLEIARIAQDKIQEMRKIYSSFSDSISFQIADKQFKAWISENLGIIACFTKAFNTAAFEQIATQLSKQNFDELVVRVEQIHNALKFLEGVKDASEKDVNTFFRLLLDNRIYSKINVMYPENIPRILDRMRKEFSIDGDSLEPFLRGEQSMSEVLGNGIITKAATLFDMIDFIERRNLIA